MTDENDFGEPVRGFDQTNGLVEGLEGDDGGAQNDDTTAAGGVPGSLLADTTDGDTEDGTGTGAGAGAAYDTVRGDADSEAEGGSDGYVEPVDDGAERGYSEEGRP